MHKPRLTAYLDTARFHFNINANRSRMSPPYWGAPDWYVNRPRKIVDWIPGATSSNSFAYQVTPIVGIDVKVVQKFKCAIAPEVSHANI